MKVKKLKRSNYDIPALMVSSITVLMSRGVYFATETDLGNHLNTTAQKVLAEIKSVYCGSVCWLLFGIELLFMFFSKDDRRVAIAKKALIGCIVAYIVLQILVKGSTGTIGTTVTKLSGWIQGS